MSEADRNETLNESKILKSVQHRHIVKYIDSWEEVASDCLYIVMEHGGEDLSAILHDNGGEVQARPPLGSAWLSKFDCEKDRPYNSDFST